MFKFLHLKNVLKIVGGMIVIILITIASIKEYAKRVDFDVDLVYLWCDSAEPKFKKRKNYYLKTEGKKLPISSTDPSRFVQVNELKYSLRSVERYLPWIHHIYIITDRQVPKWLNIHHPKITIVDHSEIIPQNYIPVFSSLAIETVIYKVPGLSEHFLLANDDTFINYPLDKKFFFKNGKPIVRMKEVKDPKTIGTYRTTLAYSRGLIERDFGPQPPFSNKNLEPHHNIDAYLKSDYAACAQHFEKEYTETLTHRFRQKNSVQRFIVSIWSIMKGHAELKEISQNDSNKQVDSIWMSNTNTNYLKLLRKNNPALFCINDNEKAQKKDRTEVEKFLKNYFPWKSEFEL